MLPMAKYVDSTNAPFSKNSNFFLSMQKSMRTDKWIHDCCRNLIIVIILSFVWNHDHFISHKKIEKIVNTIRLRLFQQESEIYF